MAFEVAFEFGNSPVKEALPTIRETAVELELEGSVFADGLRETIGVSIRRIDFQISNWIDAGLCEADALARAHVVIVSGPAHERCAARRHGAAGRIGKRHQVHRRIK